MPEIAMDINPNLTPSQPQSQPSENYVGPPGDPNKAQTPTEPNGIPQERIWKKPINGKEVEFSESDLKRHFGIQSQIPEGFEEPLITTYMKSRGADQQFNELARQKKEIADFISRGKSDFVGLLRDAGVDVEAFIEQQVELRNQLAQLSPEQQKQLELEQKIAQYEARQREIEQQEQIQREQAEVTYWKNHYVNELGKTLQQKGIPQDDFLVTRAFDHLAAQNSKGFDLSMSEALDYAVQDQTKRFTGLLRKVPKERLHLFITDDLINIVREYDMHRTKPTGEKPFTPIPASQSAPPKIFSRMSDVNPNLPKSKEEALAEIQNRVRQIDSQRR